RDRDELSCARSCHRTAGGAVADVVGVRDAANLRTFHPRCRAQISRRGPDRAARGRNRQSVLHHRHHGRAAGRRNRRGGGAESHQCRWRLQRRSQKGPVGQAIRPFDPFAGDRGRLQGHGCDRFRACPRDVAAYHRVLDRRAGFDRRDPARNRPRHHRRRLRRWRSGTACRPTAAMPVLEEGRSAMPTPGFDINELKRRMQGATQSLKHELGGLRTGRAAASMLEPVQVDAYGSHMPLNQLATISVPEPRLLSVQVWDKSMVKAVEKAIVDSNLGLSPATEGQVLRLRIPELNEERRKELVKVAHKYAEAAKVAVRHVRRDGLDTVKKLEKSHEISEDDQERLAAEVQKATDGTISEIDQLLAAKEKEILTV